MKNILFSSMLMIIVTVLSCAPGTTTVNPTALPDQKMFCGYVSETGTGRNLPCYWVGTGIINLYNETNDDSWCLSSERVGGVVYTSGLYNNGSIMMACYWEGNSRTDLAENAEAVDLIVNNGQPYIAGDIYVGAVKKPCIWTGTNLEILPCGTNKGNATGIAFENGTVYTGGYYKDGVYKACTWTGTNRTELPGVSNQNAWVQDIAVSSGTIYAGGNYYNGSIQIACYWTGTNRTDLETNVSFVYSITVSAGTVYSAGNYFNGSKVLACYWEGTNRINLEVPAGMNSYATTILFQNGKLYTGGFWVNAGNFCIACIWDGTNRIDLTGEDGWNYIMSSCYLNI